jgi:hypothetical protein
MLVLGVAESPKPLQSSGFGENPVGLWVLLLENNLRRKIDRGGEVNTMKINRQIAAIALKPCLI